MDLERLRIIEYRCEEKIVSCSPRVFYCWPDGSIVGQQVVSVIPVREEAQFDQPEIWPQDINSEAIVGQWW